MKKGKKKKNELSTYFLACEFKPGSELWSVLDGFAYDVFPAFIHGSLGIISYKPESYAIVNVGTEESEPLLGYICTITEPTTAKLLDKVKGYNGKNAFCTHEKIVVNAYTDIEEVTQAWTYILSEYVLETYQSIEQVEFGIWSKDSKQLALLEKIENG